jgi:uncharacterized protein YxeA
MTDKLETIKEALNGYNRAKLNNDISNWLHINTDLFVDLLNSYIEARDSEEMVERVAKAIYDLQPDYNSIGEKKEWHHIENDSPLKEHYVDVANTAIQAMEGGE